MEPQVAVKDTHQLIAHCLILETLVCPWFRALPCFPHTVILPYQRGVGEYSDAHRAGPGQAVFPCFFACTRSGGLGATANGFGGSQASPSFLSLDNSVSHPAAPSFFWLPGRQEDLRGELSSPVWPKCSSHESQASNVRAVGMPGLSPLLCSVSWS